MELWVPGKIGLSSTTGLCRDPPLNARNELCILKTSNPKNIFWKYLSLHLHIAPSSSIGYFPLLEMLFSLLFKMLFSQGFPTSLTSPCQSPLLLYQIPSTHVCTVLTLLIFSKCIYPLSGNLQSYGFMPPINRKVLN